MNDFMKDRYGVDELTCVLGGAGMLLALIGTIANLDPLTWIALAIVLLALARAFSKNITVRCNENNAFRSFSKRVPVLGNLVARLGSITPAGRNASGGPTASAAPNIEYERAKRTAQKMWKERKTSRFLKCPSCGQILSVPKGKGKLRVTCPRCRAKMETKS